jgi:D-alanyl-D-alanine carboxypeptidase/D-alanyl-D-alanine-endopeptidase (penicillin-binding protein 4)
LGISPETYRLVDGSGLSRRNLVTPSAIAQLLQGMLKTDQAEIFRSSLAVAGVNGTLENRFQSTPLQGKLQGKTGTLTGISALSGYVELPHYQPLIFTILLNHSQLPASQQRNLIDRILLQLSHLKECQ